MHAQIDAAHADQEGQEDRHAKQIGAHGVGLDKLGYIELIFSPDSLAAMCRLREVFDPDKRSNPGKVVPIHSCQEWRATPAAR